MTRPFTARDLPADCFPFTIEFLRTDTDEVVHVIEVSGPGVINVPPLGRDTDCPLWTRVSYANGEVVVSY